MPTQTLELGIPGFSFLDLHRPERLADLQRVFLEEVERSDPELGARWQRHTSGAETLAGPAESQLLIELAREQSHFLARLFRLEEQRERRRELLQQRQLVYRFRDQFVKKNVRAASLAEGQSAATLRERALQLLERLPGIPGLDLDEEERYAGRVLKLLERPDSAAELELLALDFKLRREAHDPALAGWRSLREPRPVDFAKGLIEHHRPLADLPEAIEGNPAHFRLRDGFKLTDARGTLGEVLDQLDQCVFCHEREKDSCSRGMIDKKTKARAKNPLGVELDGCPLDERISEMHMLMAEGDPLGALALVMLDNPMCPGTGHRICNDCMKACIYQKQEPVNIPQIETNVLTCSTCRTDRRSICCSRAGTRCARSARTRCPTTASTCSSWAWGPRATRWRTTCARRASAWSVSTASSSSPCPRPGSATPPRARRPARSRPGRGSWARSTSAC
jgi:hypothetical protein